MVVKITTSRVGPEDTRERNPQSYANPKGVKDEWAIRPEWQVHGNGTIPRVTCFEGEKTRSPILYAHTSKPCVPFVMYAVMETVMEDRPAPNKQQEYRAKRGAAEPKCTVLSHRRSDSSSSFIPFILMHVLSIILIFKNEWTQLNLINISQTNPRHQAQMNEA